MENVTMIQVYNFSFSGLNQNTWKYDSLKS